jgi:hypothetical protein
MELMKGVSVHTGVTVNDERGELPAKSMSHYVLFRESCFAFFHYYSKYILDTII